RFGLSEPPDTAPEIAARDLAVMIVPGLAFDAAGRRLGFGGGYYDGVIDDARAGGAAVIGFAYDFQIVDRVPAGPDDRGVAVVVGVERKQPARRPDDRPERAVARVAPGAEIDLRARRRSELRRRERRDRNQLSLFPLSPRCAERVRERGPLVRDVAMRAAA